MRKLWLVIGLIIMASGVWAQDQKVESPKVCVLPFTVRSQEATAKVQSAVEELLIRQLNAEGIKTIDPQEVRKAVKPGESIQNEDQARAIGRRLGADYALMGSFTQIGNSISLDVKLVNVPGQKKTEALFAEEKGMENLAGAANTIARQAAVHVLSKAVIAEVQVRGNERIEADAIKAAIKSKRGELLRPEQVRDDIKEIFKMGFFEKVDAEVSDSPAGKVLTFVVQENPTVQEVRVKGNKKIKEKDILAAIGTRPYTILQRNLVSEDVQKILKLYQQKGYYNAQVTSNIEFPKDPRKAVVTFDIKENERVYIKKIGFTGNKAFSARKLRGVMQTKEKSILSWVTDRGILQRDILDTDIDRLTVYYHDHGFMDAKVGTPDIAMRENGFYITIPVEEGERYKITDVKLAGDLLENNAELVKKLDLKPKDYFSREDLRHDMDTVSKAYMDKGYATAEVDPQVKRDPETETTSITFDVKKGEVYHIGRIFITGNTKTRDKVIRRELKLSEGDLFSASKLEKSTLALRKIDFFEEVEINPSESGQPGVMDLHIKVKEKMTGSISVGGGYSSDDGLFTSGEIVQRNFLGRGEYLGVKAYLGQDATRYVGSFTEPWIFDKPISAGIDIYDWLRDYSDFTKDAVGFRLRSAYMFGNYSQFMTSYNLENAKVSDLPDDASPYLKSEEGTHLKSSVTAGIQRDSTDHPFLPTRGSINVASVEFTSKYLGSDLDFVKTELHTGWYWPLFWKFVGFTRGEVGWIYETESDNPVPIYERFFLGGINSLRAFQWGEVGPKDKEGEIIGGTKYAEVNLELLFPLVEKLGMRGVVFFDAGNAYLGSIDVSDFRTDAGLGIRWNSPLGPLRIEWGYNLDRQPGEDQYQWQFSTGAFF